MLLRNLYVLVFLSMVHLSTTSSGYASNNMDKLPTGYEDTNQPTNDDKPNRLFSDEFYLE